MDSAHFLTTPPEHYTFFQFLQLSVLKASEIIRVLWLPSQWAEFSIIVPESGFGVFHTPYSPDLILNQKLSGQG